MSVLKSKKDRLKALNALKGKVAKKYGEDVLLTGKEAMEKGVFDKITISTPSLELNQALYCGGFSGIVELFGAPASGKTSLAIETMALAQKNDPEFIGMWLETEHSIFPEILEQHGIDLSRTIFVNQEDLDNAENALDVVYGAIVQGIPNMIVINSVAGLLPKTEMESDLDKQGIGLTARLMSKLFRKITGPVGKNKMTVVFINQVRDQVGVMFGNPETTTGGRALAFYANQRVRMNSNKIQKEDPISAEEGVKISCIVHKNRFAGMHNPNTQCKYYARFETGIDSTVGIPQILSDRGIFERAGSWWYYPSKDNVESLAGVECKFRSEKDLRELIRNNEAFQQEVIKLINVDEVSSEDREEILKEEESINEFMKNVDDSDADENGNE